MPINSTFFKPLLTKIVSDASQAFASSAAGLGIFALGSRLFDAKQPSSIANSRRNVNQLKFNFPVSPEPRLDTITKSAEEALPLPFI